MSKDQPRQQLREKTVPQLDFERRALLATLDRGCSVDVEAEALMRSLEDLDLAIAARRAEGLGDVAIKFDRLVDVVAFDPDAPTSLEAVFLEAILADLRRLVGTAIV